MKIGKSLLEKGETLNKAKKNTSDALFKKKISNGNEKLKDAQIQLQGKKLKLMRKNQSTEFAINAKASFNSVTKEILGLDLKKYRSNGSQLKENDNIFKAGKHSKPKSSLYGNYNTSSATYNNQKRDSNLKLMKSGFNLQDHLEKSQNKTSLLKIRTSDLSSIGKIDQHKKPNCEVEVSEFKLSYDKVIPKGRHSKEISLKNEKLNIFFKNLLSKVKPSHNKQTSLNNLTSFQQFIKTNPKEDNSNKENIQTNNNLGQGNPKFRQSQFKIKISKIASRKSLSSLMNTGIIIFI